MKALLLATGASLAIAVAAVAGDPYYNGYGEHAGNFTPSYPTPGCAACGGDWTPGCSNQSTCPKGYLWADYCETKDCRPVYRQWAEKLSRMSDNHGCGAGCATCGPAPTTGCGCQPSVANQLNNPYGGWDGGKLRPVSQGNTPRLAPPPPGPSPDAPPASQRRNRVSTMKPILPDQTSPSDNKPLPESQLPSLSAPIAPTE